MAQTPLQFVPPTLLDFALQPFLPSLPSTEDDQSRDNVWVYGRGGPYSDPTQYQIHPIDSSSVAPHTLGEAYHNHANAGSLSSLYAHGLPPYWVIPVVAQTVIPSAPLAHVTPLSSAPAPPPPQTQTPENDRRPGTQKEEDLTQLEQEIISSLWHAGNTLEPPCGSPDCPYIADCYGTRGMSCYTAFVIANPDGSSGCFWCPAYSARKLEDAVRHQRSNHFNHKPFVCVPINGAVCGKRYFSHTDLHNHRRRCH